MKNDIKVARLIIETMFNSSGEKPSEYSLNELKCMFDSLIDEIGYDDFTFETDYAEFRIIHEDEIEEIWTNSLIDQIKECYDGLGADLPSFVAIDWDKTAENCKVDGMGHHFAWYDGQEHYSRPYYIFRTN